MPETIEIESGVGIPGLRSTPKMKSLHDALRRLRAAGPGDSFYIEGVSVKNGSGAANRLGSGWFRVRTWDRGLRFWNIVGYDGEPDLIPIEKGHPIPGKRGPNFQTDMLPKLRELAQAEIGDSKLFKGFTAKWVSRRASEIGSGWFRCRTQPDGVRVWKTAELEPRKPRVWRK